MQTEASPGAGVASASTAVTASSFWPHQGHRHSGRIISRASEGRSPELLPIRQFGSRRRQARVSRSFLFRLAQADARQQGFLGQLQSLQVGRSRHCASSPKAGQPQRCRLRGTSFEYRSHISPPRCKALVTRGNTTLRPGQRAMMWYIVSLGVCWKNNAVVVVTSIASRRS